MSDLLYAFCKRVNAPLEQKCRHCNLMHTIKSYRISVHPDFDPDRDEQSFIIDYGRCDEMKSDQCLRRWAWLSKEGRSRMKEFVND